MKTKPQHKVMVERRGTLDFQKKETMLAVLIRNQEAFESVKDLFDVKRAEAISPGHALVWRAVCNFYTGHSELPTKKLLMDELNDFLNADEDLLDEDERIEVDAFVKFAFNDKRHKADLSTSQKYRKVAIKTCKSFLEEQIAFDVRESAFKNNTVPVDIPEMLAEAQTASANIQSLSAAPLKPLFDENWDTQEPVKLTQTKLGVIDNMMGGGVADGEVVVFMGPFGSCKTTVAMQVTAGIAEEAAALTDSGLTKDGKRPVAVLISTEMGKREARLRALSYQARIPRKTLTEMKSLAQLNSSSKPLKYEKRQFKQEIAKGLFVCEYDRAQAAISMLNEHLLFIDLSGSDPTAGPTGAGGVREIASIVASELRRRKDIYPMFFVLDHASALATRMIELNAKFTTNDLRFILRTIPQQVGELLAKKYGCPSLVMHQLSGQANAFDPGVDVHHTDAAECKAFAEYADFAIVTGTPTEDKDRVAKFKCTKHRREPPRDFALVRVDGRFSRVIDATDDFVIDPIRKTIVRKDEIDNYIAKHGGKGKGKKGKTIAGDKDLHDQLLAGT